MFNDPELEALAIESQKQFNENAKKYDEISSDIKNLEKFLQDNNFISDVTYNFSEFKQDSVWRAELIWRESRIYFKNAEFERPFIECPLKIRLNFSSHLPEFLKKCIETLRG